jgi:parallel beta-helix repeat protein
MSLSIPVEDVNDSVLSSIWIEKVKNAPRGSIKAFELRPDDVSFDVPARLTFNVSESDLPSGVKKESLRVAVLERGVWKILEGSSYDPATSSVSAPIKHFSIYGLVASPGTYSGRGTSFEVNGIAVRTGDSVHGRLLVAPAFVSFYAEMDASDETSVTITGLPTDGEHHVYVNSHDEHSLLAPSDGGEITLPLSLSGPSLVWIQPYPATIVIGGGPEVDECATYGVRTGDVCTLTMDIVGDVELRGGTLDCGGHSITQPAAYGGSGMGVLVPPNISGTVVENCTIGSEAGYFGYGIAAYGADTVVVDNNTLTDNIIGVLFQGVGNSFVSDNHFGGASLWAVALWESSLNNEVSGNYIDVDNDAITIEGLVVAPASSENRVFDNTITRGTGGILLGKTTDNTVKHNTISGILTALSINSAAWPNSIYRNNFQGSIYGVYSTITEPVDLSDETFGGNWWGHSCPGPLFNPGVDGVPDSVTDNRAYGQKDAWLHGISPGCPGDADGDGVPDASDNCPEVSNPGQENSDGIGEGDACDVTAPAPPVITSPPDGFVTNDALIEISGTSERMSSVSIYIDGSLCGETRASAEGAFSYRPAHPIEDGVHILAARCADAAGNDSGFSSSVSITVDTFSAAPVILNPVTGEIITLPSFPVIGSAEQASAVVFYLDGIDAGRTTASLEGVFIHYISDAPGGEHELAAAAVDRAGNISALSSSVLVSVAAISEAAPVEGVKGKSWITGMLDFPDPFDPTREASTLNVELQTSGVKALGGNSTNHRFEAVLKWDIRDEATGALSRSLESSRAVEPGAGAGGMNERTTTRMSLQWDGRDDEGVISLPGSLYDVTVSVVRIFMGGGKGPRCSRGEASISISGSPACIVDEIKKIAAGTVSTSIPGGLPLVPPGPCELASPRREEKVGLELQRLMNEHRTRSSAFLASLSPNDRPILFSAIPEREITTLSVLWSHWNVPMHLGGPFTFLEPYNRTSPEAAALSFISLHRDLYSLCDPASQLRHAGTYKMHGIYPVVAYQQVHKGVIVEGGLLHVALDESGSVLSISGQTFPVIDDDPVPDLTADRAKDKLRSYLRRTYGAGSYDDILDPQLLFFDVHRFDFPRQVVLAWKVPVVGAGGAGGSWYVDADDGRVWGKTAVVDKMMPRDVWYYDYPLALDRAYDDYDYTTWYENNYISQGRELADVEAGLDLLAGVSDWWDTKPFNTLLLLDGGREMTIKDKFLEMMGALTLIVNAMLPDAVGVWCPTDGTIHSCGGWVRPNPNLPGRAAAVTSDGLNAYTVGHEFTHGLHNSLTIRNNEYINEFLAYPSGSLFKWFHSKAITDSDWRVEAGNVDVSMGRGPTASATWGLLQGNEKAHIYSLMGRIFYLGSFFPGGHWDIWRYYARDVMPFYGEDETVESGMHLSSVLVQSMPLLVPYLQEDLTLSKSVSAFVQKTLESADRYASTLAPGDYLNIWIPLIYAVNALGFWSSERQIEHVDPGSPYKGYGKIVAASFDHPGIPDYESLGFFERCGSDELQSLLDLCWTRRVCELTGVAWRCRWVKESIASRMGVASLPPIKDFDVVLTDGNGDGYHDDMYLPVLSYFDSLGIIHYSADGDQWDIINPCLRSDGIVCTEYIDTEGSWIDSDVYYDRYGTGRPYAAYMDGHTGTIHVLDLKEAVFSETVEPLDTGIRSIVPPAIAAYQSYTPGYHDHDGLFVAYSSDGSRVTVQRVLPDSGCLNVSSSTLGTYPVYDGVTYHSVFLDPSGPISMVIHPQGVYAPGAEDYPPEALTGEFNVAFKDTFLAVTNPMPRYQMVGFVRGSPCSSSPSSLVSNEQLSRDEYVDPGAHIDAAEGRVFMSYRPLANPYGIAYRYKWDY